MFKSVVLGAAIATSLLVASCGKEMQEATEALKNAKSIAESAGDAKESMDKLEQRRKVREESGDTLAMATDKLLTFLPTSVPGYTPEEPEYETIETPGMSMSTVKQSFTGPNGTSVDVSLVDYNASVFGYMGAAAMFSLKMRVENAQEKSGTFATSNELVNGYEQYDKRDKDATVTYGIAGRFLLTVSASDQESTDFVRKIAESMPLNKLASM